MAIMGINGYANNPANVSEQIMQQRRRILLNKTYPFAHMRMDLEPKWLEGNSANLNGWLRNFVKPRIESCVKLKKNPLIILGYSLYSNENWKTVRIPSTQIQQVADIFSESIRRIGEYCKEHGQIPRYQYWNEPRFQENGIERHDVIGFDSQFLDQSESLLKKVDMQGYELGSPSLHGSVGRINQLMSDMFGFVRKQYSFVDRFDFINYNYSPGNDPGIISTNGFFDAVRTIVLNIRKYTPRPIEQTEFTWNRGEINSRERFEKNKECYKRFKLIKEIRAVGYYSLIDPNYRFM